MRNTDDENEEGPIQARITTVEQAIFDTLKGFFSPFQLSVFKFLILAD